MTISCFAISLKVALILFQEEKLTLGKAIKLTNLHQLEFQKELAKHEIHIHYSEGDFQNECAVVENLDAIVMRNTKDYKNTSIKVCSPTEFLQII